MSNESIPAASGSQYALVEGKIYRGDELVATVQEDGSVDYAPDMSRYRAPVVKFLRSVTAANDAGCSLGARLEEEPKQVEPPLQEPESVVEKPEEPVRSPSEVEPEPAVPVIDSPEAEEIKDAPVAESDAKEEAHTVGEPDFSEAPPQDWRGDKTPEFVDWFYENYPKEAQLRYAGRFTHRNFEERQRAARALRRGAE